MTRFLFVLALAASATCSPKPDPLPIDEPTFDAGVQADGGIAGPDCSPCTTWDQVEVMGPLPMVLDELSGLAASPSMPGVLYTHNDSGDSARFFALNSFGKEIAELQLSGVIAVDWEDIAVGPCEASTCVFLGDIGDNLEQRSSYAIYRTREPQLRNYLGGHQAPPELELPYDSLPFTYPNGRRHNAETLLVHPQTGDVYVITKERAGLQSEVFKFPRPFTPGEMTTLLDVGPLSIPAQGDSLLTGGDIHPCGNQVLFRMYNRAVLMRVPDDAGFEAVFSAQPIEVPSAIDEPQAEAICWGSEGRTYFTSSEHTGQALHRVRCLSGP
jgi:hypothetical protein